MRRTPFACLAAAVAASAALLVPAHAAASGQQLSILQDDRVLTYAGDQVQAQSLDQMRALGVDVVKTLVQWRRMSPAFGSRHKPEHFDPSNPLAYSPADWDPYDSLVRQATARGMQVFMSPAGPIPNWASGCRKNLYRECRPSASLYAQFAAAVAKRYSGRFPDTNQGGGLLPAVHMWAIWNEPNLGPWIWPQTTGPRKKLVRTGARQYRELAYAGIDAIRGNGHAADTIVLGETAPLGGGPHAATAQDFWRDLLCVDRRLHRLTGKAAAQQGCTNPRPFAVDGVSHHPYVRGAGSPLPRQKGWPGSISVGNERALKRILAAGAANGLIKPNLPIWFTEFGVSTRPPDKRFGVRLANQAAALNQVDFHSYLDPQVNAVTQFELEDDTGLQKSHTFQTGLEFGNGVPKPSLLAFRLPIFVTKAPAGKVRVWAWLRPAADGSHETVQIQNRASRKAAFQTVATAPASPKGFVDTTVPKRRGAWRVLWAPSTGGPAMWSRAAGVDRTTGRTKPVKGGAGPRLAIAPPPGPPPGSSLWNLTVHFERTDSSTTAQIDPQPGTGHVTFSPPGTDCTSDCTDVFSDGTTVTLRAAPDSGSRFLGWRGACASAGSSPTCTVSMTKDRSTTARFDRTDPALPGPPFAPARRP